MKKPLGIALAPAWKSGDKKSTARGLIGSVVMITSVILIAVLTNLRVIQADIVYKLAEPFTRTGQWPVAITIYNRANQLAPNEDYYYLFLGRAYLEYAKLISDSGERESLIDQAERDLRRAQAINPLNTDHTDNQWLAFTAYGRHSARISKFFSRSQRFFRLFLQRSPDESKQRQAVG